MIKGVIHHGGMGKLEIEIPDNRIFRGEYLVESRKKLFMYMGDPDKGENAIIEINYDHPKESRGEPVRTPEEIHYIEEKIKELVSGNEFFCFWGKVYLRESHNRFTYIGDLSDVKDE